MPIDHIKNKMFVTEDIESKDLVAVAKVLNSVKSEGYDKLDIQINSNGGCAMTAFGIVELIEQSGLQINCHVSGVCCSAAVLILCLGSTRSMSSHSYIFTHEPETSNGWLDQKGYESAVKRHNLIRSTYIDFVVSKTGLSSSTVEGIVSQDTFIYCEEAIRLNLVNSTTSIAPNGKLTTTLLKGKR